MSESIESLGAYCRSEKRICPLPQRWSELWQMLPDRQRRGVGWEPAAPLILAAWHETPAMLKMLRLAEHIEWAAQNGALEGIAKFLRGLTEDQWFHLGE